MLSDVFWQNILAGLLYVFQETYKYIEVLLSQKVGKYTYATDLFHGITPEWGKHILFQTQSNQVLTKPRKRTFKTPCTCGSLS